MDGESECQRHVERPSLVTLSHNPCCSLSTYLSGICPKRRGTSHGPDALLQETVNPKQPWGSVACLVLFGIIKQNKAERVRDGRGVLQKGMGSPFCSMTCRGRHSQEELHREEERSLRQRTASAKALRRGTHRAFQKQQGDQYSWSRWMGAGGGVLRSERP